MSQVTVWFLCYTRGWPSPQNAISQRCAREGHLLFMSLAIVVVVDSINCLASGIDLSSRTQKCESSLKGEGEKGGSNPKSLSFHVRPLQPLVLTRLSCNIERRVAFNLRGSVAATYPCLCLIFSIEYQHQNPW